MNSAIPNETKIEAPAPVADTAAALAGATKPPEATKAGWWIVRSPKRFGIIAGSTALALTAGTFGFKYLTTTPAKVSASGDTPASNHVKAEGNDSKPAPPTTKEDPNRIDFELPPVTPPTPKPEKEKLDLSLPSVPTSAVPKPAPATTLNLEIPPIMPPASPRPAETEPPLILPPAGGPPATAEVKSPTPTLPPVAPPMPMPPEVKKPATPDPDLFKAPPSPAALPPSVTDRKDPPADTDKTPVIRIGATAEPPVAPAPKPPAVEVPPPPPPLPAVSPPATPKTTDVPPIPKVGEVTPAPTPMIPSVALPPIKIDEPPPITVPPVGPGPMPVEPPTIKLPKDPEVPPLIKTPTIPDTTPAIRTPGIENPPPPPLLKPEKKDMYDEDWHPQRQGDTYKIISQQYYKTADFAAALEAYNKERLKSGDRIVRVPPPWVLEEQFPNLVGTNGEKRGSVDGKTTGNLKFEPVTAKESGERPAPLPATASSSEEYRVKSEAGETIREVAQKVYGDPNAWKKLYDLNPNLDPTQPIPTGTTIRLGK